MDKSVSIVLIGIGGYGDMYLQKMLLLLIVPLQTYQLLLNIALIPMQLSSWLRIQKRCHQRSKLPSAYILLAALWWEYDTAHCFRICKRRNTTQ